MGDFAKDIAAKAYWAIVHNDGWPKPAWSTGERLAVALVAGYPDVLEAEGATREEALSRLAGDICGSAADAETWIQDVRTALGLKDITL